MCEQVGVFTKCGSHKYFNFTPDLAVYSKGLGNGYAISACVGKGFLKDASKEVFLTGSCWNDVVSMAAALKSLEISYSENVAESVLSKGADFVNQIELKAREFDLPLVMTGTFQCHFLGLQMIITYLDYKGSVNFQQIEGCIFIRTIIGLFPNSMQVADLEEAVELAGEAMNALKNES